MENSNIRRIKANEHVPIICYISYISGYNLDFDEQRKLFNDKIYIYRL